jgi:hypothetical protein
METCSKTPGLLQDADKKSLYEAMKLEKTEVMNIQTAAKNERDLETLSGLLDKSNEIRIHMYTESIKLGIEAYKEQIASEKKEREEAMQKLKAEASSILDFARNAPRLAKSSPENKAILDKTMNLVLQIRANLEKMKKQVDKQDKMTDVLSSVADMRVQKNKIREMLMEVGVSDSALDSLASESKNETSKQTNNTPVINPGQFNNIGCFVWEISFLYSGNKAETTYIREVKQKSVTQSSTIQLPGMVFTGTLVKERERLAKERASRLRKYVFQFRSKTRLGVYKYYTTKRGDSLQYRHILIKSKDDIASQVDHSASVGGSDPYYEAHLSNLPVEKDTELLSDELDDIPSFGEGRVYYNNKTNFPIRYTPKGRRYKELTVPLEHVRFSNAGDRVAASGWSTRCIVYRRGERNRLAELDPLTKGEDILLLQGHLGAVTQTFRLQCAVCCFRSCC